MVNDDGSVKYPIISTLLEYRVVNQLYTNFVDKYDTNFTNGFANASVSQFLETGRLSVSTPNYQSFNDSVKKYITARDGYYMMDSDYSSIEYRILVSIAREMGLVKQFHDPDFDYHRSMASMLYQIPYDEVTSALRSQSKGLNFGIPYGMSVRSLSSRMGVTEEEGQKLYSGYFSVQPKVKEFFEKEKRFAVQNYYNETFFGRRRSYNPKVHNMSSIRRKAGNHPIQGTAADIYKLGIGKLFMKIVEKGYLGKVLISAFVHDEVVIECHNSINPAELMEMVRSSLMIEIKDWCPLYIGAGFGNSWYEAKKIELPVQVQTDIVNSKKLDWWDGDALKLAPWAFSKIFEFKRYYLKDYLKDKNNHGKPLSSVALGHLTELLGMVSDSTAHIEESDLEKDPNTQGIAYTEKMLKYSYSRSDALTELKEFGELFDLYDLVESANIQAKLEETVKPNAERVRIKEEDIKLKEEDIIELLAHRAKLSGAALDTETEIILVPYYKDKKSNEGWNLTLNTSLSNAKEGTYTVFLVLVDDSEEIVEVREPKREIKISPLTVSSLIREFTLYRRLRA